MLYKKYIESYIEYGDGENNLIVYFLPVGDAEKQVLCRELIEELNDFFEKFNADLFMQKFVKRVYLYGFGSNFARGANIEKLNDIVSLSNPDNIKMRAYSFSRFGQEVLLKIHNCPKKVIAIMNGYALGGGLELAMSCHKREASTNAILGCPETTLGIIPGWGGTTQWQISGLNKEKVTYYIKRGQCFDAKESKRLGIIDEIINARTQLKIPKPGKFSKHASSLIEELQNNAGTIESLLELEANAFADAMAHPDAKEGITAFLEKREAKFKE